MDIFDWIEQELHPQPCTSDRFIYDDMESQSGRCLPVIYQPFDARQKSHWRDRGSLFDYLYSTHSEGKQVLDFGPGDGWPSLIVAPYVGEVVGVDGSLRRVQVCAQNAARLRIINARFVHNPPGHPLPFEESSFDSIMAASSIEQSPDPRATLRELYRVLRPGGRLRISYEALGCYRNGGERQAWIWEIAPQRSGLVLFDRHIVEEYVRQYAITFALPSREVREHFSHGEREVPFDAVTFERIHSLRNSILAARLLRTIHPSGKTLVSWMKAIGFRQVLPTHSGSWFAGEWFTRIPEQDRPDGMAGVDRLLRPAVKTVVEMLAPIDIDSMITAIK